MKITKTFDFDAAHRLPNLPPEHKCHHLHGHTYRCVVTLDGPLDPLLGWVCDYAVVAAAWDACVHGVLDHRYLNEIEGLENPTTEVLAPWILRRLCMSPVPVVSVRVFESSTTSCICTLSDLAALSDEDALIVGAALKARKPRLPVVEG